LNMVTNEETQLIISVLEELVLQVHKFKPTILVYNAFNKIVIEAYDKNKQVKFREYVDYDEVYEEVLAFPEEFVNDAHIISPTVVQ
jgi:hypothetical protein